MRAIPVTLCAQASASQVSATGFGLDITDTNGASLAVGLGSRLALDLPFGKHAGLKLWSGIEIMVRRAELKIQDQTLWTMHRVGVELGLMPWVRLW